MGFRWRSHAGLLGGALFCATTFCDAQQPRDAAGNDPPRAMPTPFARLGPNVLEAFGLQTLLWHQGAVAVTGAMAFSGADHEVRLAFQNHHPLGNAVAQGAYWGGYFAPTVFSAALYTVGAAAGDPEVAGAGAAALQAVAVTAIHTGWLKWATGRPFPTHGGDPDSPARLQPGYAREFGEESFSLRGYLAWPSGHTSTSVAVAAALSAYYPERWWVPLAGYPLALLIGLGMMEGDHHWGSDVVAGAMIGHAVGYSIGRNFRGFRGGGKAGARVAWIRPLAGAQGLCIGSQF